VEKLARWSVGRGGEREEAKGATVAWRTPSVEMYIISLKRHLHAD